MYKISSLLLTVITLVCLHSLVSSTRNEDATPQIHYCYFPGGPINETAANVSFIPEGPNNERSNDKRFRSLGSRWSNTVVSGSGLTKGTPTTITWSVVPDGTSIYGYNPSLGEVTAPSNLKAFFNGIYGTEDAWRNMLRQSFALWSAVAGVKFVELAADDGAAMSSPSGPAGSNGIRGDIRIGGHKIDGSFNVLAYAFSPNSGDMVIDTADTFFSNPQYNGFTPNVIAHELGHALGLGHTCPMSQTKLMEPMIATTFWGPQHDDIRGAQNFYGDTYENNDTPATAYSLGTVSSVTNTLLNASLDDASDLDFYKVAIAGNALSVTVTPIGMTYSEGPATDNCATTTGNADINSLVIYPLNVQILSVDGATIYSSANGIAGSITTTTFTATSLTGSNFIIKVFTSSTTSGQVQMYRLDTVSTGGSSPVPPASTSPSISITASRTATRSRTPSRTASRSPLRRF